LGAIENSDKVVVTGTCTLNGLSFSDCSFAAKTGLLTRDYVLIHAATLSGTPGSTTVGTFPTGKHGTLSIDPGAGNLMLKVTNAETIICVY